MNPRSHSGIEARRERRRWPGNNSRLPSQIVAASQLRFVFSPPIPQPFNFPLRPNLGEGAGENWFFTTDTGGKGFLKATHIRKQEGFMQMTEEQRRRVTRVIDRIQAALECGVKHFDRSGRRLRSVAEVIEAWAQGGLTIKDPRDDEVINTWIQGQ
jgi:hypothetical protein